MPETATPNQQLRDRLKSIRTAINTKRDERATALAARNAAREAFAGVDLSNSDVVNSDEFKAAELSVRTLGEIDDALADLQVAERGVLAMLGEFDTGSAARTPDAGGVGGRDRGTPTQWDAHQLLADGRYRQALSDGIFTSTARFGSVLLGEVVDRDSFRQFLAPIGTPEVAGGIQPDNRGILAPQLRPLSLLDIIPTGTTDSNTIDYVQVTAIPEAAAEVAELAVKPEAALTLVDATAPVRTIAGWIKLARQALDDMAALGTLINTLLPYDVRRRIEGQILAGDGVGQNLRGILNTTGIGAPAFVAGDNAADAILRAMTTVIMSDGNPNFAALNPLTWQDLLLMREDAAARTGAYLYGSPAMMAAPTIWGLTITPSRIVPAASPLVGDSNGATLLVREAVNVKVSDSDQDDFVRNRVTVLAEARVAFPVWRPASFARATLTA